jgi:hypothetical protein
MQLCCMNEAAWLNDAAMLYEWSSYVGGAGILGFELKAAMN